MTGRAAQQPQSLRYLLLVAALLLPAPLLAAGFACSPRGESRKQDRLDEPGKVVASSRDTPVNPKAMQAWLRRLVRRHTYGGYVDLCGNGNPKDQRPVTGKADCIAERSAPNVHCKVNVHWEEARRENGAPVPGGVSRLSPAQWLFSIEFPEALFVRGDGLSGWGLLLVQVDSQDNVEWISGTLAGDTFTSTEQCPDKDIPGQCYKTTRITAKPDSNEISMLVDIVVDRERVLRQAFLLHREPTSRTSGSSPGSSP